MEIIILSVICVFLGLLILWMDGAEQRGKE